MTLRLLRDARFSHLAARAREGDERAFERLYGELYPLVVGFVTRRIKDVHGAEEVVASTFHSLVERLGDFEKGRGSLVTWTLCIARTKVIDHARARRKVALMDETAEALADLADGPLECLLEQERLRLAARAFDELAPAVKELLLLRYGDNLSHREIAAVVGADEAAVRQRLSRAVRQLRARLENDGGLETEPCES